MDSRSIASFSNGSWIGIVSHMPMIGAFADGVIFKQQPDCEPLE
jgi:hypothetical protein